MAELYLGKQCNPQSMQPDGAQALLDTRRLVRHGVLLGMTGSGKTGMGVCLLEEAAMAGVPVLAVDPKGDLANLALVFPQLRSQDFEPWIDPSEARRKNVDVPTRAEQVANTWKEGHASWGIDAARRERLAASRVTVYTPGSSAGVPVDAIASLRAPAPELRSDQEGLTELAVGTVAAVLGLAGVSADAFRDPEAIVLTQIVYEAWAGGIDLTLEILLARLVDPPFAKIGVFPVDTFLPRDKRMALAMKLNAVVASPAFAPWSSGVPLDLDLLLAPRDCAPVHVFTLSHLDESMRSFFIATLLNALVAWSRRQPGTGDLRALLYMDEVYGMLPPHPANPPTKQPLLTLMKQARAVGVGVVVATQNPVDLDYKALSNAGTWLVGRLQTAQDREKVIDGLAAAGGGLDRGAVDGWLQQLPGRVFVHRDAEEAQPRLVHSRWAISYLRGPLTRQEIERLPKPDPQIAAKSPAAASGAAPHSRVEGLSAHPPPSPGGVAMRYLAPGATHRIAALLSEVDVPRPADGRRVWVPAAWIRLNLRFDEGSSFATEQELQRLILPLGADPERAVSVNFEPRELIDEAPAGLFAPLPVEVDQEQEARALEKALISDVHRRETLSVWKHAQLRMMSEPGESRERFVARVEAAAGQRMEGELLKLKERTEKLVDRLQDRIDRKQLDLEQARTAARAQQAQEVLNVGETLLGLFLGRRRKSLSTTMTRRRQTMAANARIEDLEAELQQLEAEVLEEREGLERKMDELRERQHRLIEEVEETRVGLEKNDIALRDFCVLWVPL